MKRRRTKTAGRNPDGVDAGVGFLSQSSLTAAVLLVVVYHWAAKRLLCPNFAKRGSRADPAQNHPGGQ